MAPPTARVFLNFRVKQAENFNRLLTQHLLTAIQDWTCDEGGWKFQLQLALIQVAHDPDTPLHVVAISETTPREFLDAMRIELRSVVQEPCGPDWSVTGFAVTLLQLAEGAKAWQQYREDGTSRKSGKCGQGYELGFKPFNRNCGPQAWDNLKRPKQNTRYQGRDARETRSWISVLENPHGVDLMSIADTAIHLLGKPVIDICAAVFSTLRILHVEPVFRSDLESRFLREQESIRQHLLNMSYSQLRLCVSTTVKFVPVLPSTIREILPKN